MAFDKNSASILILLSLPFQFNIILDAYDLLHSKMLVRWPVSKDLTYYENYFAKKITFYVGCISSISFIFIFYRYKKMRLILSVGFLCNAITWLIYLAANENVPYLFIILRGIQGIYLGLFQMSHITYILHFVSDDIKCFCGCLIQVAMFTGLFIINLLLNFASWQAVVIIAAAQSFIFCGSIWLVPEINIKPKSVTHEYVTQKGHFRNLLVMMLIMLIQQLSGIGTLLGQVSRLLSGVGLNISSYMESCLFDFIGGLSTMIAAFIIDQLGTRFMWCLSSFGLFVGLIFYAATLKVNMPNWAGALGAFIYFLFYGLGVGPTPWFLCGILFPESLRLETSAINIFENLFLSPILDLLWSNLEKINGQFGSVIFSAVFCVVSIFCGFLIPKENRDVSDGINIL